MVGQGNLSSLLQGTQWDTIERLMRTGSSRWWWWGEIYGSHPCASLELPSIRHRRISSPCLRTPSGPCPVSDQQHQSSLRSAREIKMRHELHRKRRSSEGRDKVFTLETARGDVVLVSSVSINVLVSISLYAEGRLLVRMKAWCRVLVFPGVTLWHVAVYTACNYATVCPPQIAVVAVRERVVDWS